MKIVVIIPIKSNSERVKGKNFRMVNGIPLYRYLCDKMQLCHFDEVYIDSDSEEIRKYCSEKGYHFIPRIEKLKLDTANGNHLLEYHASVIEADLYFQLFVTAPLLSVETINKAIFILKNNMDIDSIFTVNHHHTWFWYNGKPVNYDPKILPRSQDAMPLISETTGLYGIRKNKSQPIKYRIGEKPYMLEIKNHEAIDLDNERDFEYLEYYVKKYMHNTD